MPKSVIVFLTVLLGCMFGCQSNRATPIAEDPVCRKSHLGMPSGFDVGGVPSIITSAIRGLGIGYCEIPLEPGELEYRAQTASGEKITIKAVVAGECKTAVHIEVWGEEEAAERLRDELKKVIHTDINNNMRAFN